MPTYGVIDLGSNSIRLVIYEVKDDRRSTYSSKDFKSIINDKRMACSRPTAWTAPSTC